MCSGGRIRKRRLPARAAGAPEGTAAALRGGEVHRRVVDAELIELVAEAGVAFHSEADVIDGFRCAIAPRPLRADDVDQRMPFRIKPVARNAALDGERSLAFPEIEDRQEEAAHRR